MAGDPSPGPLPRGEGEQATPPPLAGGGWGRGSRASGMSVGHSPPRAVVVALAVDHDELDTCIAQFLQARQRRLQHRRLVAHGNDDGQTLSPGLLAAHRRRHAKNPSLQRNSRGETWPRFQAPAVARAASLQVG